MDYRKIIDKYYKEEGLKELLLLHSGKVRDKALEIARRKMEAKPGLELDLDFIEEAAMLHDIGIVECNAPSILCTGQLHYLCHGLAGACMLRAEGLFRHALVCERHTGAGLTREEIVDGKMPLPAMEMLPVTPEEKIICYADKFYSKSGDPAREKSLEQVRRSMAKFGEEVMKRFEELHEYCNPL